MEPTVIFDTTILIGYLRAKKKDETPLFQLSLQHTPAISALTRYEFLVGKSSVNAVFIDELLRLIPVLPFDAGCADIAASIFSVLKARNQLIGMPDIAIGATALYHKIPLATHNTSHFQRIDGLTLL